MTISDTQKSVFCRRLKEARQRMGLSQRNLGIAAGIDEFVASTRVNRYEQGVHEPDVVTLKHLADALNVPQAYFYAEDDLLARLILLFGTLGEEERGKLLKRAQKLAKG